MPQAPVPHHSQPPQYFQVLILVVPACAEPNLPSTANLLDPRTDCAQHSRHSGTAEAPHLGNQVLNVNHFLSSSKREGCGSVDSIVVNCLGMRLSRVAKITSSRLYRWPPWSERTPQVVSAQQVGARR